MAKQDATTRITKHLPGGDPEKYALDLMNNLYADLIRNDKPLPIRTEYWLGALPAKKSVVVSYDAYDHADPAEKARVTLETVMGIDCIDSTFCITSYYDLLNLKDSGDTPCIIVMMHVNGSLLNFIGAWDENLNFTMHTGQDVNGPADSAWRGVTSANISLAYSLPSNFYRPKDYFKYLVARGYDVDTTPAGYDRETIENASMSSIERFAWMSRIVSGEIDEKDIADSYV